jgi:UDP-perosamine 4-acetyltransferase
LGIVAPTPAQSVLGVGVIGDDKRVLGFDSREVRLVNGMGSVADSTKRAQIFDKFRGLGYRFATIVHPSAVVSKHAEISEGAQIMAGVVVQPGARLGLNCIINTCASIDHDCNIGDHVHIAPGVTLSGGVIIASRAHVGTGATVIQGVRVGEKAIVGAGAVVIRDVPDAFVVVGVPAQTIKSQDT